jgi:hypothetical protein
LSPAGTLALEWSGGFHAALELGTCPSPRTVWGE